MKTKTKKVLLRIGAGVALLVVPAAVFFTNSGTDLPVTVTVAATGCLVSMWCVSRVHKIREEEGWEANREQIHPIDPQGRE